MLPGAALGSLAARFCWQGQHFRLWTVPERVSGPPPLMLPGAALGSLAARFCWQGQHFRLWTVPERVSGPPPLMLPGAALGSLAARFCWQGQHFRLWTVPERVSGPPPLDAARRSTWDAGRGSTSGSGRYPSAFRGPLLMLPGAALGSLAARFCWQGHTHTRHTHVDSLTHTRQTHTRSLTVPFAHGARAGASLDTHTVDAHTFAHGARARFTLDTHLGASRLVSAGRGSTSGSGRCPSAFRGPPPLMLPAAALGSLAARFCWQGQHFRLWTVPERVSGPPPLDAARRSTWQPRGSFLLAGAALQALDGTRVPEREPH